MSLNFITVPSKRLAQGITSSSSSFYVNNIIGFNTTDSLDVTSANLGTQHYCVFRNDTGTKIEIMEIDPTTISTGPITIVRRGLSYYGDRTTEVTANKLDWSANETIVNFGTDAPQLFQYLKEYIDAAAIAGAVDASTTAKGIVEEATQAEVDAGTTTGGTSAKLFAPLDKRRGKLINDYAADSVGTDSYAITISPAITAYATGQRFTFKAGTANTGACTLNVSGLGAKTIKKNVSVDLETGDILANQIIEVEYDGTYMQMLSRSNDYSIFTTREDITIGNPVGTSTVTDLIARAIRVTPTDWVNVPTGIIQILKVISVDTNKYILLFTKVNGGYTPPYAVAFTVSDTNVITFGTAVSVASGTGSEGGICKLDTNKFVAVSSQDSSNNCVIAMVCTVSGTTITTGSGQDLTGDVSITYAQCCQLDTDKYAFCGYTHDSAFLISGVCTVSGTTSTVVDTDTTAPSGVANANSMEMIKIATNKWATLSGSGYAFICTLSGSTITVGSSLDLSNAGNDAYPYQSGIISAATDTFWAYSYNTIMYCTVATRTITKVASLALTGTEPRSALFLDGTSIMQIYSSLVGESGIYELTCPSTTIIQTAMFPLVMYGTASTVGLAAVDDATTGYVILGESSYYIEGMSFNFIGIAQETASKGNTCKVKLIGRDTNQSGLLPGAWYKVNNGALEISLDLTTVDKVKALSATEIII